MNVTKKEIKEDFFRFIRYEAMRAGVSQEEIETIINEDLKNKLIILNHAVNVAHIYDLERKKSIDEEYIDRLGINSSECSWIAGDIVILKHKEILT